MADSRPAHPKQFVAHMDDKWNLPLPPSALSSPWAALAFCITYIEADSDLSKLFDEKELDNEISLIRHRMGRDKPQMMRLILGFLLLAACNQSRSQPAPLAQTNVVPMNAQAWDIVYSPGMPPHPTPQTGGGWYFDLPAAPNSILYVLATVNVAASSSVDTSILVTTTGAPIFVYNLQPDNNCTYPAHVRFLLQEKGDDLSGTHGKQYFRWWSNVAAYELAPGAANLSAPLTDLSQWTSVFGEKANASAAAKAGFEQAIANIGSVGFSFGGGCFYGHGVRVSGGRARFIVNSYTIE